MLYWLLVFIVYMGGGIALEKGFGIKAPPFWAFYGFFIGSIATAIYYR